MIKEQRAYVRLEVEGNALLKPEDATFRTIKADLFDLCSLGFGVCAPEKIEPGIQVRFEFTVKSCDEPLFGKGKIIYAYEVKKDDTRAFKMGIKFIKADSKEISNILNVIQHDLTMMARKKDRK